MAASFGRTAANLCEQVGDPHSERARQGTELTQADVLAACLDVGDRRPADAGTIGKLKLRETAVRAQRANALADAALYRFGELVHSTRSSIPTL
jgi:hypothetical protein